MPIIKVKPNTSQNYDIDLSVISFVDEIGEVWVANESLVDVFVFSSDPDIVCIDPTTDISGKLHFDKEGFAVVDVQVTYQARLIAAAVQGFAVGEQDVTEFELGVMVNDEILVKTVGNEMQ